MARSRINPLAHGIMGAIVGGLQFQLSQEMERMRLEAEMAKEQRLIAIEEMRAQRDFEQRKQLTQLEHENQLTRDELNDLRGMRKLGMQQEFTAGQNAQDRQHQMVMENQRTGNNIKQADATARIERRERVYGKVFSDTFDRQMGPRPGQEKGVWGTDGNFYPAGTNLPQGVTPMAGVGTTNMGTRGTAQSQRLQHRGQRVGEAASVSAPPARPAAPSVPAGHSLVGYTPQGRPVYQGPDGQTYVDE